MSATLALWVAASAHASTGVSTLTTVADVGQALAGAAAVAAIFYGGRQLHQTARLARENTVIGYLARFNDREFYDTLSRTRDRLSVPPHERDRRWKRFMDAPTTTKQSYFLVINLFEELGTLYNDKMLDRRAAKRLLGDASLDYWAEVAWFVMRYQQESDPLAAAEWLKMNEHLQKPSWSRLEQPWRTGDLFGRPSSS